ncbi:hypothetical protein [Stutzerimonas nitrititolerans]|uniref:hypothetical protein n=1 Tax=Stutzerimonas nitrititolerans TaxID=2482751 RepID=UPI0028972CE9|nr:hypothetical protein [Stutzerimonas nitrititolerans]
MDEAIRYVIFTGANERAVVAVCRYFQRNDIACSLVARPGADVIRKTRFVRWVDAVRRLDYLNLEDILGSLLQLRELHPQQRLVFLPTAESIIRLVLENREAFESVGLEVPLVDRELYETISDKSTFLALMKSFGVPLPRQIKQVGVTDLPVVAKPLYEVSRRTGRKIYPELIFTAEALEDFLANDVIEDYFFQKYLNGRSYYFLAFFPRNGRAVVRYQENLLQQPNGKSMLAARLCGCPDLDIESRLLRGFQSVGFFGFVMVELIEVNGVLHLIEANPRLWGPFELAIKAGFRPDAIMSGVQTENGSSNALYLWMSGLIISLMSGGSPRRYPKLLRKLIAQPAALFGADIYLRQDTLRLLGHELSQALRLGLARLRGRLVRGAP